MRRNGLLEKTPTPRVYKHLRQGSDSRQFVFDASADGWARNGRQLSILLFHFIQRYLYSLKSPFDLGLLSGAAAALMSHKILIISFHSPLSVRGFMFLWP